MSVAKNKMRLGIFVLLVLCLLQTVTQIQLSVCMIDIGANPKAVLFTPALGGCDVSVFILDRRANFSSFDGLFKDALILGQVPFNFTGRFSPSLTEYTASFIQRADRSAIPIRAPPFLQKLNW
jgi:hypothetical protein